MTMNSELEQALSLPDSTWGFLEWATGVLRINATVEEIKSLDSLPDYERLGYEETITHEMFHLFQICTAGYLYYFATLSLREIYPLIAPYLASLINFLQKNPGESVTTIGHNELWQLLMNEPPMLSANLKKYFQSIDEPGNNNITIREIVEGSAYLAQKQIHSINLTAARFSKLLEYAPGNEYVSAYWLAESILESHTFDLFNVIAFISLCFQQPHLVFVHLCEEFKKHQIHILDDTTKPLIEKIIDHLRLSNAYLGTSDRFVNRHPTYKKHPFYFDALKKTVRLSADVLNTSFIELMASPQNWAGEFRKGIGMPILLNPDEFVILEDPAALGYVKTEDETSLLHTIFACTYSLLIMKSDHLGFRYIELRKPNKPQR